jgi:hypothetical protein
MLTTGRAGVIGPPCPRSYEHSVHQARRARRPGRAACAAPVAPDRPPPLPGAGESAGGPATGAGSSGHHHVGPSDGEPLRPVIAGGAHRHGAVGPSAHGSDHAPRGAPDRAEPTRRFRVRSALWHSKVEPAGEAPSPARPTAALRRQPAAMRRARREGHTLESVDADQGPDRLAEPSLAGPRGSDRWPQSPAFLRHSGRRQSV